MDVEQALSRYDPTLGSFVLFDRGGGLDPTGDGPLSGLIVAVKDLVDVGGWPTTNGASGDSLEPARRDAAVVAWLRRNGARIIGKTALNEYAYGVTGYNPHHGWILNPRDRSRTAGGSSGGSAAAVAAGVADIGVGTDTSGSIRLPAACCGVYGFKAAHGAYDMTGVTPLAPSFDSIGFLATDVAILCRVLGVEELPDDREIRVGEVGVDLETPALAHDHWTIFRAEAWAVHYERFTANPDWYGKDVQRSLRLTIGDVKNARDSVARWRDRYDEATADFDVLAGPVLDGAAPLVESVRRDYERGETFVRQRLLRHTPVYNALGWPALSCPTTTGNLQLAARPGDEAKLLSVAQARADRRRMTG
jgi:Asp-tRNA(Asn)/Glu-tRNA(Gln) amidotransferase A subunit family amidase